MESESSHGGPLGGKLRSDLIVVTREHKPLCPITSQFRTQIRLLADFGEVFHSLPRRLFLTYIFLTGNIVQLEVPGAMTGKWTGGRSAPERRQGLMPRLLGATPGDQPRSQRPWIGGRAFGVRCPPLPVRLAHARLPARPWPAAHAWHAMAVSGSAVSLGGVPPAPSRRRASPSGQASGGHG
jgi:hypothetical protein